MGKVPACSAGIPATPHLVCSQSGRRISGPQQGLLAGLASAPLPCPASAAFAAPPSRSGSPDCGKGVCSAVWPGEVARAERGVASRRTALPGLQVGMSSGPRRRGCSWHRAWRRPAAVVRSASQASGSWGRLIRRGQGCPLPESTAGKIMSLPGAPLFIRACGRAFGDRDPGRAAIQMQQVGWGPGASGRGRAKFPEPVPIPTSSGLAAAAPRCRNRPERGSGRERRALPAFGLPAVEALTLRPHLGCRGEFGRDPASC